MKRYVVLLAAGLLSAGCGSGDGPIQRELVDLRFESLGVIVGRDTAVVSVSLNTPALVRLAYAPAGTTDTVYLNGQVSAPRTFILKPLAYNQTYSLRATATAPGQDPATHPVTTFATSAPPDPCTPAVAAETPKVDLRFEYRIQPAPDESLRLEFVEGANCDGSLFSDRAQLWSLDGGYAISDTFKVIPNLPYGSKPLTIRAGLIRAGKLVRWLGLQEFTLNGKHATRLTEERPAPPCEPGVGCTPSPAAAFDLNAAGVVDP